MNKLHQKLKELKSYTRHLILFKSKQANKSYAHIQSFRRILEQKLAISNIDDSFFNGSRSNVVSFLRYMLHCGQIVYLGNGYYMVLEERLIRLPVSKRVISTNDMDLDFYFQKCEYIELKDYRYDYSLKEWKNIFVNCDEPYQFKNSVVYKPTSNGLRKVSTGRLEQNLMYYAINYSLKDEKEHFVIINRNGNWYGTQVNQYVKKSKYVLLTTVQYEFTYEVFEDKIDTNYLYVKLSDYLPEREHQLLLIFTIPNQLYYSKVYLFHKKFIRDVEFVLKQLKFTRKAS